MKIQKSKSIQIQLSWFATFGIIFLGCFTFVLGREYTWWWALSLIGGSIGLSLVVWIICLILIKGEKQYFIFERDRITLWKQNELLCELKKSDFVEIEYQRFVWAFLMQMGSGYLNITCPVEVLSDKKYASVVMPNGMAVFGISMSTRQAKEVAKILSRNITIK